ncbi:MAG: PqqD family peptide modification chaperone [Acidimicrobiia bacterium]|nr:PqqD family peptide modification chaperone [Acidimicrobiia bacterium]
MAPLGDHLLVHDPAERQLHVLNPTAAAVWQVATVEGSPRGVSEVIDAVAASFAVAPEMVADDVCATIEGFRRAGLVVGAPSATEVAESGGVAAEGDDDGEAESDNEAGAVGGRADHGRGEQAPAIVPPGGRRLRWLGLEQLLVVDPPLDEVLESMLTPLAALAAGPDTGTAEVWTLRREPPPERPPDDPAAEHTVVAAAHWMLTRNGVTSGRTAVDDQAIRSLLVRSNAAAIEASDTDMVVHAGVVAGPAGAVLIVGDPDAGKSTLTAALGRRGARYLTDEAARVRRRAGALGGPDASEAPGIEVVPYPKPLSLAQASMDLQAAVVGPWPEGVVLVGGHLDPAHLGGGVGVEPAPVVGVVLPDRSRPAEGLEPLDPVPAALRLAGQVFNLPARGQDGLELLSALCTTVPVYEVGTDGLHGALELVEGLIGIER